VHHQASLAEIDDALEDADVGLDAADDHLWQVSRVVGEGVSEDELGSDREVCFGDDRSRMSPLCGFGEEVEGVGERCDV
jgi:hypothetical protein